MLDAKYHPGKHTSYPFHVSDDPVLVSIRGHADPPQLSHITYKQP